MSPLRAVPAGGETPNRSRHVFCVQMETANERRDSSPALPLLIAAAWLLMAGMLFWKAYVQMIDDSQTELVGVEPTEGDSR